MPLDVLEEQDALTVMNRAAPAGASIATDQANVGALREVVHLLDGLPLALELAGARLALLTPRQLRDRLGASTGVLKERGADRRARHRSLRATIDWTLGLLDEEARRLFTRLGAFAGPVEL